MTQFTDLVPIYYDLDCIRKILREKSLAQWEKIPIPAMDQGPSKYLLRQANATDICLFASYSDKVHSTHLRMFIRMNPAYNIDDFDDCAA